LIGAPTAAIVVSVSELEAPLLLLVPLPDDALLEDAALEEVLALELDDLPEPDFALDPEPEDVPEPDFVPDPVPDAPLDPDVLAPVDVPPVPGAVVTKAASVAVAVDPEPMLAVVAVGVKRLVIVCVAV